MVMPAISMDGVHSQCLCLMKIKLGDNASRKREQEREGVFSNLGTVQHAAVD